MSASEMEDAPFTLQDCYLGPRAGRYALRAEHTVTRAGAAEWRGEAELGFEVSAPRLRLPSPDVVHGCYPPPGGAAFYGDSLPYVSLARRSLPWERTPAPLGPDAAPAERATPWLALLVLTPDDLRDAVVRSVTGATLAEAPGATGPYAPWGDPALAEDFTLTADERAAEVSVLELDAKRFRALCPRPDELRALAHVRSVDARHKAAGAAQAVAHFALLLANRLPQAGLHTAALVSLEGWGPWLADPGRSAAPRVRVVVLHRWQFESLAGVGTCAAWVKERLSIGPLALPRERLAPLRGTPAEARLASGYTPVRWRPAARGAEAGFGWFRGPLVPERVPGFADPIGAFESADAALVVDEATGMVDHAYAAAWQLGRLSALAASSFAAAIRGWSRDVYLAALREEELRGAEAAAAATAALPTFADAVVERFKARPPEAKAAPRDDVRVAAEWLADLLLLTPVPLRYLVPSDKLLPPESARVFFVDERWLDALVDGAVSVGVASLQNRQSLRSRRSALRGVLRWLMGHRRAAGRGEALPAYVEDARVTEAPLCGLLLRSGLLRAFPGVEVELWGATGRVEPLRVDLVADGVLLVLARGAPSRVVVREPREGLRFGRADRFLSERDDAGALVGDGRRFDVKLRDGAPGVIDVAALASTIGGARPPVGGARFALQWLLPPQDVEIPWQTTAG